MKTIITIALLMNVGVLCGEVEKVLARATKYHKTEKGCDPETKKGNGTTQIKLRDNCDDTIGMVAVDPKKIPYGSLIYSPDNKRFYLACDKGGAVSSREAAKKMAQKKGLPDKYSDALVLDFYSPREILDDHFGHFIVIEHVGEDFRHELRLAEQKLRLEPEFWLARVKTVYKKSDKKLRSDLREVIARLKGMS